MLCAATPRTPPTPLNPKKKKKSQIAELVKINLNGTQTTIVGFKKKIRQKGRFLRSSRPDTRNCIKLNEADLCYDHLLEE